ncbi:3'-5' exonuclease [Rhodoferax sp.]|uniref:3'-5' exonuclease n=1 Tax=Rhodoferax sp. TaxID=50421 RepID=UPI0028403463|nr:3'-5' exonuclease [Rhodoferax sp.]MDR3368352.1 3'-5' exonuclease [Rhodoferax sp.]
MATLIPSVGVLTAAAAGADTGAMARGADRAKYGDQLIKRVGDQLAQEFGGGFEAKNLRRMVQFAQVFAEPEIVATLSQQLNWSRSSTRPCWKRASGWREGQEPLIIKLPTLQAEAEAIADHLAQTQKEGHAWGDMAVLCADTKTRDLCARTLAQRKLPVENRLGSGDFDPTSNKIKVMTMKVRKGLEFPVVALPDVGHMPAKGEDEKEAARVFYVAATRATQRLVMGVSGNGGFGERLRT